MTPGAALTKRQISHLFKVTPRQVENSWLQPATEIKRGEENLYLLVDVIAWYRDMIAGGKAAADEQFARARADVAMIQRDEIRGQLVQAKNVERFLSDLIVPLKEALARLPSEAASRGMPGRDVTWISDRIEEVLNEASRKVLEWDPPHGGGAVAPPVEDDAERMGG